MTNKISITEVKNEDCQQIRDLMVTIYQSEKETWFKNGDSPFIPGYNSIEMQKYHMWNNQYYKIMYGENIAGVILISYTGKEHARIDRFYILPKYQGLGIGSMVLSLIEERYPEVHEWTLDTIQQSLRNHHFYEKNGYKLVGEDENEKYYCKLIGNDNEAGHNYCRNVNLNNTNYRECLIEGADLYDCNMSNAYFTNMNLCGNTYQNSGLRNSRYTNVDLSNSIFADGKMNHVKLCFVSLTDAYIHDINLDVAENNGNILIERCELSNSKIIHSNLKNLCIEDCNVDGMTINGIKVADLLSHYHKTVK